MLQGKQIDANALMQGHLINQKGQETKKLMEHSSDIQQIYHQAAADLQLQQQQLNKTNTTTPVAPPPPQQGAPLPTGPQQQPNPEQQLKQAVQ